MQWKLFITMNELALRALWLIDVVLGAAVVVSQNSLSTAGCGINRKSHAQDTEFIRGTAPITRDIWINIPFLRRGRQPEENISRARKELSPRFFYYLCLMAKRYLAIWMWLCEGKLKVKLAHFRLPSASQKRVCLSSLIAAGYGIEKLYWVWPLTKARTVRK